MNNKLKNLKENLKKENVITQELLCQVIAQFMIERNIQTISIMQEINEKDNNVEMRMMGGKVIDAR